MTELHGQIAQALHAHHRQHETSMYCECGAWATDMDTHRADTVARLVQPALDRLGSTSAEHEKRAGQLEELLAIAHETSNTAEAERARLAAEVDRLGDWYRAVSERVTTAEAERDRYHGELAVNETDRVAAVRRAERAEADLARVIGLYEQWLQAGPPPLGTLINRWWDRRLIELRNAILEPAEVHKEQP